MNHTDVPIWEKYTLTIEEAAKYFRIGENKLRKLAEENPNANWDFDFEMPESETEFDLDGDLAGKTPVHVQVLREHLELRFV